MRVKERRSYPPSPSTHGKREEEERDEDAFAIFSCPETVKIRTFLETENVILMVMMMWASLVLFLSFPFFGGMFELDSYPNILFFAADKWIMLQFDCIKKRIMIMWCV